MVLIETRGGVTKTEGGQYVVIWTSAEDIETFLKDAVIPQAAQLGLKVTFERTKENIVPLTQRPT